MTTDTTGSQVFVSYSRDDKAKAQRVADALEALGWSVFFDQEIRVGESWDERIERELRQARAVVVLWSPASVASRWVKNEARIGEQGAKLAPALIEPCDLPVEFSHVQAADLTRWSGDQADPEWRRLVEQVAGRLGAPPPPAPKRKPRRAGVIVALLVALAAGAGVVGYRVYQTRSGETASVAPPPVPAEPTPVSAPAPSAAEETQFWSTLQQMIAAGLCEDVSDMAEQYAATGARESDKIAARGQARLCFAQHKETVAADAEAGAAAPAPIVVAEAPQPERSLAPRERRGTAPAPATAAAPAAEGLAFLRTETTESLSEAEIAASAARLGVDVATVKALLVVEAATAGFDNGRIRVLYEPHIFSRLTSRRYDESHPDLSAPSWNPRLYPRTQAERWAQVERAFALDPEAALKATSWGRFQPLGINHELMDYASVRDMVADLARSEAQQLQAFERLVVSYGLKDELQRRDWIAFARRYNGPGQADRYRQMFEAQYAKLSGG